jgi:hypothetical protein
MSSLPSHTHTHAPIPATWSGKLNQRIMEWIEVAIAVVAAAGFLIGFFLSIVYAPTMDAVDRSGTTDSSMSQSQFWMLHDAAMIGEPANFDSEPATPAHLASASTD